ncbi:MAG: hypothetical protein QM627_08800 [Luteolibacter sp.]
MSRSYHVTKKKAIEAFREGDLEPAYQQSEKCWVKQRQLKARKTKNTPPNRSIVSGEISRTKTVRDERDRP